MNRGNGVQYILNPEVFAIGGGISAQSILLERIKWAMAELKKANLLLHMANPKVIACQFRNDANLYGALYHFSQMKKMNCKLVSMSEHIIFQMQ